MVIHRQRGNELELGNKGQHYISWGGKEFSQAKIVSDKKERKKEKQPELGNRPTRFYTIFLREGMNSAIPGNKAGRIF